MSSSTVSTVPQQEAAPTVRPSFIQRHRRTARQWLERSAALIVFFAVW